MPNPFDMPPQSAGFDARAGWVVERLMLDLEGAKLNHAGSIVGNLGGESGLEAINERHPLVLGSRGGFGWGQWTGPRRVAFEAFCETNGLALTSDEGNYRWLLEELRGSHKHALAQLLKTSSIEAGTYTFEVYYERPKDLQRGLNDRIAFAKRAIAASLGLAHAAEFEDKTPAPLPSSVPAPLPRPVRARPQATPLHLAGGMGIGYALTSTLSWILNGYPMPLPQDVTAGWVLLFAIPGAVLLHSLPWLKSEIGGS